MLQFEKLFSTFSIGGLELKNRIFFPGPGTIAQAIWSGHNYARTLGEPEYERDEVPFDREIIALADTY